MNSPTGKKGVEPGRMMDVEDLESSWQQRIPNNRTVGVVLLIAWSYSF